MARCRGLYPTQNLRFHLNILKHTAILARLFYKVYSNQSRKCSNKRKWCCFAKRARLRHVLSMLYKCRQMHIVHLFLLLVKYASWSVKPLFQCNCTISTSLAFIFYHQVFIHKEWACGLGWGQRRANRVGKNRRTRRGDGSMSEGHRWRSDEDSSLSSCESRSFP